MQETTLKEFVKRKKKAMQIIRALKKIFPQSKIALRFKNNWELMVAVQLSAQCTDKKVNEVTETLFKKYKKLDEYVRVNKRIFERDIRSTGFYRNKARNILACAKIIKKEYGGTLPGTMAVIGRLSCV